MRLKDKVAIVTGSARGLGKGIAVKLAEEGAKVVIADMAGAEETAKEICDNGGIASAFKVNVAKQDEMQALVKYAIDTYGTLDIMVNNAGINRDGMLHKMPVENWDTVIAVDLTGTFYGTQEAIKYMRQKGYGRIINIASMYGLVGNKVAGSSPYHAAKGGVVNLTRALAAEWSAKGINVNAICPGYFYTPLTKETLDSEFFQENARTMIPAERYGNEGELDTAVLFLASPASSYVTGIMVPVDGGYTCM